MQLVQLDWRVCSKIGWPKRSLLGFPLASNCIAKFLDSMFSAAAHSNHPAETASLGGLHTKVPARHESSKDAKQCREKSGRRQAV